MDESGSVFASYVYNGLDMPISMWREGETFYYMLDHLGSVLGLVDSTGIVTATYQYDPWGNLVSSIGSVENPLRFTAREFDDESGLYYFRLRYYDPAVGRFISRDPVGLDGGLNYYSYVHNNSVRWRDPYGLGVDKVFVLLWGAVQKVIKNEDTLRKMLPKLSSHVPKDGKPVQLWTTIDKKSAELYVRKVGPTKCVDTDAVPYVSAKNKNGSEILRIFYGQNASQITAAGAVALLFSHTTISKTIEAFEGHPQPLVKDVLMLVPAIVDFPEDSSFKAWLNQ